MAYDRKAETAEYDKLMEGKVETQDPYDLHENEDVSEDNNFNYYDSSEDNMGGDESKESRAILAGTNMNPDDEGDGEDLNSNSVVDTDGEAYYKAKLDSDIAGVHNQYAAPKSELQRFIDGYEEESKADREKREKREKSKRIISAVSDGLSALGNLYFTTQYAPNMYDAEKGSMSEATRRSIEKAKEERESNRDKHINYILKLGALAGEESKTVRDLQKAYEEAKLAREENERKKREDKRKEELHPDNLREAKGKADKAQSDAGTAKVKEAYAEKQEKASLNQKNASANASNASAANSYAHANDVGSDRVHFNGKSYAKGSSDHRKDVFKVANSLGIPTTYSTHGGKKDRDVAQVQADIELKWESEENTPPSRR